MLLLMKNGSHGEWCAEHSSDADHFLFFLASTILKRRQQVVMTLHFGLGIRPAGKSQ
jgi:hypothetical protein